MVKFATAEGKPAYHPADSLDEAVRFVERLRNMESVDDVKILAVSEVPFEFKSYFKVELSEIDALQSEDFDALAASKIRDSEPDPEPASTTGGNSKRRFSR